MVFGQFQGLTGVPRFGQFFSNVGQKFGDIYNKLQSNPQANALLNQYNIPSLINSVKDAYSGIKNVYNTSSNTYDMIKRNYQKAAT